MKTKTRIFSSMLALVLILSICSPMVLAASPSLSAGSYIKTYPLSLANDTYVYTDTSLSVRGTSSPKKAYNSCIYASDEIKVYTINATWSYVSYNASGKEVFGYIRTSSITSNNYSVAEKISSGKFTTYKRAGKDQYGYVDSGDKVYTIASSGCWKQIIYECGLLWKMGWVSDTDYNKYVIEQPPANGLRGHFDCISARAGYISIVAWALDLNSRPLNAACFIDAYIGGEAGSGAPGFRFTADNYRPDVGAAFPGTGTHHGLEAYDIPTNLSGYVSVYLYAVSSDNRVFAPIGVKTVFVPDKNAGLKFEYPLRNAVCSWRGYSDSTWSWSEHRYGGTGGRNYHLGLDMKSSTGATGVYAAANGKIVAYSNSNKGANGRYVVIEHIVNGKTVYSFYAHLSSLSANVRENAIVDSNTQIGVIGGSGNGKDDNYGTHLHFAIVDTLWTSGGYWGYATEFSGNSINYGGVTYYNPRYVVEYDNLP